MLLLLHTAHVYTAHDLQTSVSLTPSLCPSLSTVVKLERELSSQEEEHHRQADEIQTKMAVLQVKRGRGVGVEGERSGCVCRVEGGGEGGEEGGERVGKRVERGWREMVGRE